MGLGVDALAAHQGVLWEGEWKGLTLCVSGAGPYWVRGAVVLVRNYEFCAFPLGAARGPPGIFGDYSEEGKKEDSTHIWSQTPNRQELLVPLPHRGQTGVPGAPGGADPSRGCCAGGLGLRLHSLRASR